uniref:Pleckstrin homology domain containing, family A member 6 n=1 Tax=Dicentrarchus labrax TaxID=13489 RepID=A0A8P4KIG1_DICLA
MTRPPQRPTSSVTTKPTKKDLIFLQIGPFQPSPGMLLATATDRNTVVEKATKKTREESEAKDGESRYCDLDMNGKVNTAAEKITHSKTANMVSHLSPEAEPYTRTSRTPRKGATFGKRSNSMRRNPKAEVTKQGWLYKQASSGVKQWNKRWFVLTDRCLFYYKDDKEDTVLGSLPLLSFQIGGVEPSDNITRKFAFKAEHAGTRTYYFSTDSHEEQEEWIRAMSEASEVNIQLRQRNNSDTKADLNHTMVTKAPDPQAQEHPHTQTHNETDSDQPPYPKINGVDGFETPPPSTPLSNQEGKKNEGRHGGGREGDDERGGSGPDYTPHSDYHPNGCSNYGPRKMLHNSKPPPSRSHSGHRTPQEHQEESGGPSHVPQEQQENVVLRRGFVPRTAPERVAQRKSSMAQLQQWVNQRRGMASQEDINSPSHYYQVSRGVSADYYGYPGGPQYVEEYPLYTSGVRPDSICSVSAFGGYDRRWTIEDKRHSLRDGHQMYGPPVPRDQWGQQYYGGMETSMRRLSIQPRSRSVPRSPSSSSGGPYSPVPHNFASPARSPSARFDRFTGRMRDDVIYADPSVYSLRRSLSSPKYDYPGDRRSLSQGLYHCNYPESPYIHNKMEDILDLQLQRNLDYLDHQVLPFHDVYSRELHPTLKLNEIETSKLLGRLCEQNRILKDHEAVVHRLRMDKDSLEDALVETHQEMELYHNQPLAMEKLRFKKETLQNQLINIRGELSQASSALTTTRMEFEALEDEASAIHGDLWEQLNAGGQSELVRRHIQKEFWRVQDVLEGLHKNHSSRGTDTAKHRVTSGASGSFSTNSPASPLSSVSLTSPLSPFSPVPGSQASPTKQLGPEPRFGEENNISDVQDQVQDRQSTMNKVGIVPPRTKSPTDESHSSSAGVSRYNGRVPNGISRIRRRLTAHEIDIKDLEAAVRGQGQESPREEIARLRRLQVEPEHFDLDMSKELMAPDKVLIPERYLDVEDNTPLSPEEQKEKQKKLERIKTLIAKSNLQNMVPLLDGPVEGGAPVSSQQQLQEQEKRIEISCALAAEASRRSRLLSAQCAPSPSTSPTSLAPPPSSAGFPNSAHIMKV